jgi:hypothetical protein
MSEKTFVMPSARARRRATHVGRRRLLGIFGAAAGLVAGVALSPAFACTPAASLQLTPSHGPAGQQVTASGTLFKAGDTVLFHRDSATGPVFDSVKVQSADGTFSYPLTIPADVVDQIKVVATAPSELTHAASDTYTIASSGSGDPGTSGSGGPSQPVSVGGSPAALTPGNTVTPAGATAVPATGRQTAVPQSGGAPSAAAVPGRAPAPASAAAAVGQPFSVAQTAEPTQGAIVAPTTDLAPQGKATAPSLRASGKSGVGLTPASHSSLIGRWWPATIAFGFGLVVAGVLVTDELRRRKAPVYASARGSRSE